MSTLEKSGVPGTMYKVLGDTATGTSAAAIKLSNAYTTVPSGMDTFLGFWAHLSETVLDPDEGSQAWGYWDSPDGINIKPYEFLFPNPGTSDATTSLGNSTPGVYYPVNCPVTPGDRLECYAQDYIASTTGHIAGVTLWFGRGVVAPKALDDQPGRHRWRVVGHTEAVSVAAGYGPEAQYQFTTGRLGGYITEVGGVEWADTAAAAQMGQCIIQMNSDDVPIFPMEFHSNSYGSQLGVVNGNLHSRVVTRRQCSAAAEKVVHMDCEFLTNAGNVAITDNFVSMVEFTRFGE